MNEKGLKSIVDLELFLAGSQAIAFIVLSCKEERYKFIDRVLNRFNYKLKLKELGLQRNLWVENSNIVGMR